MQAWSKYNELAKQLTANRVKLQTAGRAESREPVRKNHDLMVAMDRLFK